MQPSSRLERIPPYLFAELERKVREKRAAGIDVISLGIGDPDRPTPPLVVEAMQEAVADPGTHRYPSNRGRQEFREAISDFYERRFDVDDSTPRPRSFRRSGPRSASSTSTSPSSIPATSRWPPTPAIPSTPAVRWSREASPCSCRSCPSWVSCPTSTRSTPAPASAPG